MAIDRASAVMLVVRPDLAFDDVDGLRVWRETKTGAALRTADPLRLVETDMTAAMYLLLLAATAERPGALEWEQLTATAGELTVLDALDDDLVAAARTAVSAAVGDLTSDTDHPARPGPQCDTCPQGRWCRARP